MPWTRSQALEVLGLAQSPDADAATIQQRFERLARRYPQLHFPERFRQLLEARDQLLDAGRGWRELIESTTLDLTWIVPYLSRSPAGALDRRTSLQRMLRAGYLAEPVVEDQDGAP